MLRVYIPEVDTSMVDLESLDDGKIQEAFEEMFAAGGYDAYLPVAEKVLEKDGVTVSAAVAVLMKLYADSVAAQPKRSPRHEFVEGTYDNSGAEDGYVRFMLSVGHRDFVKPADIVAAALNGDKLPKTSLGRIDILRDMTFAEVKLEDADVFKEVMNKAAVRGRPIRATVALPSKKPRDSGFDEPVQEGTFENSGATEENMVRFRLSLGMRQGIKPNGIVGTIAGECGIAGSAIGRIDLGDNASFVEIPREYAETVLAKMKGQMIHGRPVRVTVAHPEDVVQKSFRKPRY